MTSVKMLLDQDGGNAGKCLFNKKNRLPGLSLVLG